ncbi:TolC family protein [Flavobacterium franklandianum]|uniref:TolC family protein n=1 Tax=Flavobacterium franklandianum TaxID=2594430 RepID=A0A553CQL0_9FLAO|nr:TolC family protein [Flavobacterium franklandianum]TRX22830.1 TolC family protein [Flavobacterium franklandianum]
MKKLILLLIVFGTTVYSQTNAESSLPSNLKEISYNEYLGFVKKYHPLVKNANLEISKAQANLMMARGGFDPKLELNYNKKQFQGTEYYSIMNSSFKIPTWYGIDIKAGFDENEGYYLDPQNKTPSNGLTSLGISVPLGQGLLINQRMADLQKAKIQVKLSQAQQKLEAIAVLYDASVAYFNWKKNYEEYLLYENYSTNAQKRYEGIESLIKQGDKPAIDSIEAGIVVKNRLLALEDSKLKLTKAKLELSNFLWLENNIPLELADAIIPEKKLGQTIQETLNISDLVNQELSLINHPKIEALQSKIDMLTVEKKMKANMLLPKIDVGYSYLAQPNPTKPNSTDNYKVGVDFYFPLFLRKERGGLKLAQYKIQETEFTRDLEKVQLTNKISAQKTEIQSLTKQQKLINNLVTDYDTMLKSEVRLFTLGESSLFLINTRENNLVSAQLSQIALENRFYTSNSELYKIMANPN